ncbi:hypothetical protein LI064_14515 [Clostridium perfringens]|uniref:hypothetical protein n=1 Tax=Clostridium perfringens TaxID=1502 RepID=UPI002245BC83|nr:hypothetical protein [Clostridium perfringens]MCX0355729.1 hypothetical protein [Clostridium perfringens]
MFKKVIYIGENEGNAIYFDTKRNIPLKSSKSKLLNTEKTKNNSKYIIVLLTLLFLFRETIYNLLSGVSFQGEYTYKTVIFLVILSALECFILTMFVHRALYKNMNLTELATEKEFDEAIKSNNIWNMFGNKEVTVGKKVNAWVITLLILVINIGYIFILIDLLGQQIIVSEFFKMALIGGFIPFFMILLIWENNLIRWFNVVEKYQKGKVKINKD